MAIAAGIPQKDAQIIAYASQFVDDSTGIDSKEHKDHGLLYGISTAHHPIQSFLDQVRAKIKYGTEEQRKIWVPFHFLPGGKGKTFSEKLLCIKNSNITQEMLEHNLEASIKKPYGLELLGITAHVYMDTFSHYGFSGIASSFNRIKKGTLSFIKEPKTAEYILGKFNKFTEKYVTAKAAQSLSKFLGHASAATYPDRPYLYYRFDFEKKRPEAGTASIRNNSETFFEGCKGLHAFFSKFAQAKYAETNSRTFEDIKETVQKVISCEENMNNRIKAWYDCGLINGCEAYNPENWEMEKKAFPKHATSEDGISTNAYRFHQAASFHRYYVLKDLLPSHGIAVY